MPTSTALSVNKKGFTLIELMVVIAIIAILSVIGITVFSSVQKSARDAKRRLDGKAIALALEQYKLQNGLYPQAGWVYSDGSEPWIPGLDGTYMQEVPKDPKNTGGAPYSGGFAYGYFAMNYGGSGQWFMLVIHLESPSAADLSTSCRAINNETFQYANSLMICNQQ